jgi:hypothetical protein
MGILVDASEQVLRRQSVTRNRRHRETFFGWKLSGVSNEIGSILKLSAAV